MTNRPKNIGTAGETAVVRMARESGFFPHADRLTLSGSADRGDVRLTRELRGGVIVEVKAGDAAARSSDLLIDAWMAETEAERQNAQAALGVLVVKRAGYAGARCGRWWAVVPLGALVALRGGFTGQSWTTHHGSDALPVRMHLDALMPLLATVYGEED